MRWILTHKHAFIAIGSFLSVAAVVTLAMWSSDGGPPAGMMAIPAAVSYVPTLHESAGKSQATDGQGISVDAALLREAQTLRRRILSRGGYAPSVRSLAEAFAQRNEFFKHSLMVRLQADDGHAFAPVTVSLHDHPLWLLPDVTLFHARYVLDLHRMREDLTASLLTDIPKPVDARLIETQADGAVLRAKTDGIARPGYALDAQTATDQIASALVRNETGVTLALERRDGKIVNDTGKDLGDLRLLSSGHSDFQGSGAGRIANVRKGLREKINNVLIAPGETFSFNKAIGNVTIGKGWFMALVIVDGQSLEPAPGGGLCQVATTLYRGVIESGLPVVQRANHSLYVHYYEKYGVGLDATVFQGKQDFAFKNDTPRYLLLQSYDDGFDAYVNLYGTPDGRSVSLKGPYFADTAPAAVTINRRPLQRNEIAWIQHTRRPDGTEDDNIIWSRYKAIPRSLPKLYKETVISAL